MATRKIQTSDPDQTSWRIKKEISLGDLIAFGMAFFSVVYAYFTLNTRLAVLEDRGVQIEQADRRKEGELQRSLDEIRQGIRELNAEIRRWYSTSPRTMAPQQ